MLAQQAFSRLPTAFRLFVQFSSVLHSSGTEVPSPLLAVIPGHPLLLELLLFGPCTQNGLSTPATRTRQQMLSTLGRPLATPSASLFCWFHWAHLDSQADVPILGQLVSHLNSTCKVPSHHVFIEYMEDRRMVEAREGILKFSLPHRPHYECSPWG